MKILVTGTAGFIGSHLAIKLLERGEQVVGIDNINNYYDPQVKYGRLKWAGIDIPETATAYSQYVSKTFPKYRLVKGDLEDKENLFLLFQQEGFDAVCHLAAQAGVRYSLTNPDAYISSNIVGFINILEACRHHGISNLSYASSSSVYGLNRKLPFSTKHNVDHPISLYAASKKSNELMAHTYSHLYGIRTTGLRFFTVYGPWGRPDMALFLFVKAALEGQAIEVFNHGEMLRDFTYIDDVIEGVIRVIERPATSQSHWDSQDPSSSSAPYKIYNIGNNRPVKLMDFITAIEKKLGKVIDKKLLPIQPGDVPATFADVSSLTEDLGYQPQTPIQTGIDRFVDWYLDFFKINH